MFQKGKKKSDQPSTRESLRRRFCPPFFPYSNETIANTVTCYIQEQASLVYFMCSTASSLIWLWLAGRGWLRPDRLPYCTDPISLFLSVYSIHIYNT